MLCLLQLCCINEICIRILFFPMLTITHGPRKIDHACSYVLHELNIVLSNSFSQMKLEAEQEKPSSTYTLGEQKNKKKKRLHKAWHFRRRRDEMVVVFNCDCSVS